MSRHYKTDFAQFQQAREKGLQFIQILKQTMRSGTFAGMFEMEEVAPWMVWFNYLGRRFEIRTEMRLADDGPTFHISAYMDPEEKLKDFVFLFDTTYDLLGNINQRFTHDDFAAPYLEGFINAVDQTFKESGKRLVLR